MNTGVAVPLNGTRPVRYGVNGQADISGILMGKGTRLEIECKAEKSGYQSKVQKAYQRGIERFGGVYILARSVDDVWAALAPLGYKP